MQGFSQCLRLGVLILLVSGCAASSPEGSARQTGSGVTAPVREVDTARQAPAPKQRAETTGIDSLRAAYVDRAYEKVVQEARRRLADSSTAHVSLELYTLLGRAEQARGRHRKALPALRKARVIAYEDERSVLYLDRALGESLAALHRWPEAASAFRRVLDGRPNDLAVRQALGDVYRRAQDWEKARQQYARLVRADSSNGNWWARLAESDLELDDMNHAIRHFARAHDLFPQAADVALTLSRLYRTRKQPVAARRVVDTTLTYRAGDPRLWRRRADLAFERDQMARAHRAYERAMVVGDTTATILRRIGLIEVNRERFARALPPLRRSYRLDSLHPRTTLYLGISYARVDSLDQAVTYLQRTIDRVADGPITPAYKHLGAVHNRRDDVSKALEAYRTTLRLEPEQTEVYFRLATVYDEHYREKATAAKYYRRFLTVSDSTQTELRSYSENRLDELRTILHMQKGATVDSASER